MNATGYNEYLYQLEEASNLYQQVSQDTANLEGSSINNAARAWQDLNNLNSYSDLLDNPNSSAGQWISQVKGDAETYMQSTDLEVAQPNAPAGNYIQLYNGNLNEQDNPATLWDAVTNSNATFVNNEFDAYFDNSGGPTVGLGTNWSENGSFSWSTQSDGNPNNNGQYATAEGTAAQWEPFVHLASGDTSALNHDLFKA